MGGVYNMKSMKKIIVSALFGLIVAQVCANPVVPEISNVSTLASFIPCASSCDQIINAVKSTGSSILACIENHPYIVWGSIICWIIDDTYKATERFDALRSIRGWELICKALDYPDDRIEDIINYLVNNAKTEKEVRSQFLQYIMTLRTGVTHEVAMQAMKDSKHQQRREFNLYDDTDEQLLYGMKRFLKA